MSSFNLKIALDQFSQAETVRVKKRLTTTLRFVLKQYVLPLWIGQKYTSEQIESNFEECLANVSIKEFRQPPLVEDAIAQQLMTLVADGKLRRGTADNYRSVLNKFIKWIQSQEWYARAGCLEGDEGSTAKGRNLRAARKGQNKRTREQSKILEQSIPVISPADLPLRLQRQIFSERNELGVNDFGLRFRQRFQEKYKKLPAVGLKKFYLTWEMPGPLEVTGVSSLPSESDSDELLKNICHFMWWLDQVKKRPVHELEIEDIIDPDLLCEFIIWGFIEQGYRGGWDFHISSSAIQVSQWLFHLNSSDPFLADIEELVLLKKMYRKRIVANSILRGGLDYYVTNEKYLSLHECEEILSQLYKECEIKNSRGLARTDRAIMQSWQRYLICAIIYYSGLRVKEVCHLKVEHLAITERIADCAVIYFEFGKNSRRVLLPNVLSKDLDRWVKEWRSQIHVEHGLVFFSLGSNSNLSTVGQPLDHAAIYSMISKAIYKHSGKVASPTMLRRFSSLRLIPLDKFANDLLNEMAEFFWSDEIFSNPQEARGFLDGFSTAIRIQKDLGL
ncbi:site-specific integrase [Leptolyngbya sp. NIES-2104]|uniref:site-specific integrase n=1 Tax=Leptolyngbya sp. NIES-2104 TaxID=1552121 RepID=UPI0006ECA2F9|nr:site-specific integrase [Leptolyngbya sp. NIES-2104]GAP97962.1 predicted protein [Leptolyngbya sp. NIES-2104]